MSWIADRGKAIVGIGGALMALAGILVPLALHAPVSVGLLFFTILLGGGGFILFAAQCERRSLERERERASERGPQIRESPRKHFRPVREFWDLGLKT
jgi:hypothetical protein